MENKIVQMSTRFLTVAWILMIKFSLLCSIDPAQFEQVDSVGYVHFEGINNQWILCMDGGVWMPWKMKSG